MIIGRRFILGRIELQSTDALILLSLFSFSLLTLIFQQRVEGWMLLIAKNVGIAFLYVGMITVAQRVEHKFLRFFLRVAPVTLAYAYLFGAVDKLQLILYGQWLDPLVLSFEQNLFGDQPTLWLEQYTTPWLTEWMMFSYVVYVPMYPVICGIIYYLRGELPMEEYFFTLGLTNVLCDIGFILFPVAGPIAAIGHLYSVPLDGYVFTFLGELMRSELHYIGGTIPSPHCAAATIMWVMAYRYHRPSFHILTPVILSLYISTFYGRYHYLTDAVVGVAVAGVALMVAPYAMRLWDKMIERGFFTFGLKDSSLEQS